MAVILPVFALKMKSVSKITIFGLKLVVTSGLGKIFLKLLRAGNYFPFLHKRVDFCQEVQIH